MLTVSPTEIALVKPAADLAIALLKPLAKQAWEWTEEATERIKFELNFGAFDAHLQNSYKRHSYFTSLVFKNEQKKLLDHYLPLTLLKHPNNETHVIDKFPHELMRQYRRLLIVDTAGMGKSTISKFLFLTCIRENAAIPILIELRKLSEEKNIIDFIVESTSNVTGQTSRELIIKLIDSGRFMFVFDGYDEISESNRSAVAADISKFITAAPDNWFVMTSRDEASLSAFPDFQRFTIKPLEKSEAYQLLRLYDKDGYCAEELIKKLEEGAYTNVHEFLTNPLLTSLLFKSFEFKRAIPIRKHIFYRQVFEALFETHDLMKEDYQRDKRSGLDIDQFDELLRYLSFLTYKSGKFSYSKDELLAYIDKTKQLTTHKSIISSRVVHDLTHSVPLMVEEGNDIRWVHRSMQEYFAAQWVCRDSKERQKDLLIKMYKDLKHQNLIVLCADIDPIAFKRTVIKEIALKLLNEYETSYTTMPKIISTSTIKSRKKVVSGKVMFIKTIPEQRLVDDDVNLQKEWVNNNNNMLNALKQYCESLGFVHQGAQWGGDNPISVGLIRADTGLLELPQFQQLIQFIRLASQPTTPLPPSQMPQDLPIEYVIPVNDNPDNIINSEDNFDKTTALLARRSPWYFDYDLAKEILGQIELEEIESKTLEL